MDRLEDAPGLEVGNHLVSWEYHKLIRAKRWEGG